MESITTIEVNEVQRTRSLRDRFSEDIVRDHVREFFVQQGQPDTTQIGDKELLRALWVFRPIEDIMKVFRDTKVKGYVEKYREGLLKLINVASKMSVTPDLALLRATHVFRHYGQGKILIPEECSCDIALVEVKRGRAKLDSNQKKDVKIAEKEGVPYYLIRVDDSGFLNGRFLLERQKLTTCAFPTS
jgi:hypothetical protein